MDAASFAKYLKERYEDQLNYYSSASKKNQKKYKNFQWLLIILSTLTTILAALPHSTDGTGKDYLQYAVVITAAAVTILTAALKTFQYQELWVSYRTTIEELKPEIYYYQFGAGDYGQDGADKEKLFVSRVEAILSKEHQAWPMFKQAADKDKYDQQMAALQTKLDELSRASLGTSKVQTDPAQDDPANDPTKDPANDNTNTTSADVKTDPATTDTGSSKTTAKDKVDDQKSDDTSGDDTSAEAGDDTGKDDDNKK